MIIVMIDFYYYYYYYKSIYVSYVREMDLILRCLKVLLSHLLCLTIMINDTWKRLHGVIEWEYYWYECLKCMLYKYRDEDDYRDFMMG